MNRLAVFGWDDEASRLLAALTEAASFRIAAVGDRSTGALVRARAATGVPCFPHALEMFQHAQVDAALIDGAEGSAQAAHAAARAGAAILLVGSDTDGATVVEAAETALREHVPFVLLRPRLQHAGLTALADLAASDAGWRPRYLEVTFVAPDDSTALMSDAVALANRLMSAAPRSVVASTHGGALDDGRAAEPRAIVAELHYPDGRLASLRTRMGATEQTTLFADCSLGELELRAEGATSTLTMTFRDGRRETSRLADRDVFVLEAQRAARAVAGGLDDALPAPTDGVVLTALERSIETGQVATVEERSRRANLVLVEGRGTTTSVPRGQLHLVGG